MQRLGLGKWRATVVFMCILVFAVVMTAVDRGVFAMGFGDRAANLVVYGQRIEGAPGPVLFDARTYVPIKAIEGPLGLAVHWETDTKTLYINSLVGETAAPSAPLPYKEYETAHLVINDELITPTVAPIVYEGMVYLPVRELSALGLQVGWDARTATAYIGSLGNELPVVGSLTNLEKLLNTRMYEQRLVYKGEALFGGATTSAPVPTAAPVPPAAEATIESKANAPMDTLQNTASGSSDYSTTNVQVQGVDEADIVKTDGQFIYQVRNRQVSITRAYPVADMKQLATISFTDQDFYPQDLYVDGKQMVVIGRSNNMKLYQNMPEQITKRGINEPAVMPQKMIAAPYWGGNPTVKAIVYNIENAAEPKLVREVELEGDLLTSRKVGNHIYLLSNQHLYPVRPLPAQMRDTAISEEFAPIGMDKVQYFPGGTYSSYLLIAAFDLNAIDQGSVTEAFLGAGNNVYMSEQNLYISIPKGQGETAVYRFAVDKVDVEFKAKGAVPGNILNQFSMDEYQGHLRIATTSHSKENGQLNNNVYVLDTEMKTVGKVEGIAPNERIYSARFMGDKGYLVTFELVDPLFVLDLSKPADPKILGALKIPGFSNYLHPLDENHLLGIGRDTDVIDRKDASGKSLGRPFAIEKGIKLAIFDVRDVSNPIEKFSTVIGARGSSAEVLQNHKALYYENGLLGFALNETKPAAEPTQYGSFTFQGAVLYDVSLESGFDQVGKFTHLDTETYLKMGQYWHGADAEIRRIIRIGDTLYIISNRYLTAHDIKTLELVKKVESAQQ